MITNSVPQWPFIIAQPPLPSVFAFSQWFHHWLYRYREPRLCRALVGQDNLDTWENIVAQKMCALYIRQQINQTGAPGAFWTLFGFIAPHLNAIFIRHGATGWLTGIFTVFFRVWNYISCLESARTNSVFFHLWCPLVSFFFQCDRYR